MLNKVADGAMPLVKRERAIQFRAVEAEKMARSAMMGFIEQGRFDEGRALLATATDADGNPGALPLPPEALKERGGRLEHRHAEATARKQRLDRVDTVVEGAAEPTYDPTEWRALVEERFAVVGPQMAELDPAERIGAEDDYVRNVGHLPKPLMRFLRAGMLPGEPACGHGVDRSSDRTYHRRLADQGVIGDSELRALGRSSIDPGKETLSWRRRP